MKMIIKEFLLFFIRLENSINELVFKEKIIDFVTKVPELGDIYLPYGYRYHKNYYLNCEMNSKKWVVENVKPDWNIIDIGANVGYYSIIFGKLASKGSIFSIEPTSTFKLLKANLNYHQLSNVNIFNIGINDHSGKKVDRIFKNWGKRSRQNIYSFFTLDDFVSQQDLKRIDLIKIDTDGFEMDILRGALKTLDLYNPFLLIEFRYSLNTRGYEVGNLLEKLIELGYREAYLFDGNNLLLKKPADLTARWTKSISIVPHEYLSEEKGEEDLSILTDRLKKFVKSISASEFIRKFNPKFIGLNEEINARLPGRGPKMEVNDAPFLASLYKNFKSDNHLELGTWEGFGTSLYCSSSTGKVTTVNLPDGETLEYSDNQNVYSSSYYPALRKRFTGLDEHFPSDKGKSIGWIYRMNNFEDRVTQIFADTTRLKQSDFNQTFDSILIDGGHDKSTCISDSKLALSLLSEPGLVIWHDFTLDIEELSVFTSLKGVLDAILELEKYLIKNRISLYWIEQTWILVGFKAQ